MSFSRGPFSHDASLQTHPEKSFAKRYLRFPPTLPTLHDILHLRRRRPKRDLSLDATNPTTTSGIRRQLEYKLPASTKIAKTSALQNTPAAMPKRRNSLDYFPCNNCKDDNKDDKWRTCNVLPGVRTCTNCMVREIGSTCVFETKVQGAGAPAKRGNAEGGQVRRSSRSGKASKAAKTSSAGPGVPVGGGTAENEAAGQEARDLAGAAVSAGQRREQTEGNAPPVADDEFHAVFNTPIGEIDRRHRVSELMTVEQVEREFKGF